MLQVILHFRDLFGYLEKNHPEIIAQVLEKYDLPNAGTLVDGKLGARTVFAASLLGQLPPAVVEQKTPPKEETKEHDQPKGAYVVNVRGDENNGKGAYYFFEEKADFEKFIAAVPSFTTTERKSTSAQATFDMNNDVFLKYHAKAPEIQALLGTRWLRSKDGKGFVKVDNPQKTTAHYNEGLAQQ